MKAQLIYQRALVPSGIGDRDQLRALVCDGPALLAWVGTTRPEVFAQREVRLYQALVPGLTRRLILERDLGSAPASLALLDLALESISAPAYVLHRGWIAHANAAGREALDADASRVRVEIAAAVARRAPDGISVSTLGAPGAPTYALVVDRRPRRETLPRVIEAARCWGLTARQIEVLRLVAEGRSNKTIAVILGCSERTVEVHVAALLERSESESRAMLVARLWSEFG